MTTDIQFWVACAGAIGAVASAIAAGIYTFATFKVPRWLEREVAQRQAREREYEAKKDCLRRIVGYRSMPPRRKWLDALSEAVVTFNSSPQVRSRLVRFVRNVHSGGGHSNDELVKLIESMMDDLELDRTEMGDDFLLIVLQ